MPKSVSNPRAHFKVLNFVPVDREPGFAVLFPSVTLARSLLERAARAGLADQPIFGGYQPHRTVRLLLEGVARTEENRRIQGILQEIQGQVCEGLGVDSDAFIELPALFQDGMAVIPNMVNSLVVGRHVLAPDPLGPTSEGEDAFRAAMERPLRALRLGVHFANVWDYYHAIGGEVHCGTNAVRRSAHPEWWLSSSM
jgi:protein-arginine deiminase